MTAVTKKSKEEYQAMTPRNQISYMLETKKDELAKLLPATLSIDRLLKVATIAATTTPALLECEVPSLISAIGTCVQLGFEPNTPLQHAYLVPFNASKKDPKTGVKTWHKNVQVIIGYRGLIDLAKRSGEVKNIGAQVVYANDVFTFEYNFEPEFKHVPALTNKGDVVAFYAFATLKDGSKFLEVMAKEDVDEIKVGSQSKGEYGPWKDNYPEMGRKTAIRRLSKYLPLSIQFQTAVALDIQADNGNQNIQNIDGEYIVMNEEQESIVKKDQITMPASKKQKGEETAKETVKETTKEALKETAHSAIVGDDSPDEELISEQQAQVMFGTLKDAGVDEFAFEEEYGYKVRQLPSKLYEGTLNKIAELITS